MSVFNTFVTIASMLNIKKFVKRPKFYVGHRNDYTHYQVLLSTQLLSRTTVFFDT